MAELGARLALAAELVRHTRCAADIGTDHGYLIVDLVRSGRIERGLACDIRPDPLSKAVRQITAAGLQEKITAVLTDGLVGIDGSEVDDVVIAGMGGDLISTIIDRAPWLRDPAKHLVLQPMTRIWPGFSLAI